MLNWILGGAFVVGMCMLMAFGEEADWVRGGLRNLGMIAAFGAILGVTLLIIYWPA
jgi:hypothetical protein